MLELFSWVPIRYLDGGSETLPLTATRISFEEFGVDVDKSSQYELTLDTHGVGNPVTK